MKSEEIKGLVAKSENACIEFKRARGGVPADFWPSYSAFANTDGGVIILGVREKRMVSARSRGRRIRRRSWPTSGMR